MNIDIKVSIIVPCYNCEATIEKCVESIRNQTYKNIEIILVDDGSIDNTSTVCDSYSEKDGRIITIHQANSGLVRAWKTGVRYSAGEYIAFCDADDYIDDDLIEKTVTVAAENNIDIVAFGIRAEYVDSKELLLSNNVRDGFFCDEDYEDLKESLLFSGKMQSQKILNSRVSKLFRREIIENCMDNINDKLTNGEDAVTTYATIMNSNTLYNIADYYPYHYVRNDQSMVGRNDPRWLAKMIDLREGLLENAAKSKRIDLYQIDNYFFSYVIIYAKKEISRSRESMKTVVSNLLKIRKNIVVEDVLENVDISKYSLASRVFANLFINNKMFFLYYLTKIMNKIGYGKQ